MKSGHVLTAAVVCALLFVNQKIMANPAPQDQDQPLPTSITTELALDGQTFITKSILNFDACYTNVSAQVLGDDETVEGQLHAVLYANGKQAGQFSVLLEAVPTLAVGATWCDTFFATVPPTHKTEKVALILRVPMRLRLRTKIDGVVDSGSESYAPFRVEERRTSPTPDDYWLVGNDEGHDTNPADGVGGTPPGIEIGEPDFSIGNEGFWAINIPNEFEDTMGVYAMSPPSAGSNIVLSQFDFSVASLGGGFATPASVGIFANTLFYQRNFPDLSNPIVAPVPVSPPVFNSISGGDHGNSITFSPVSIPAGDPIWALYFTGFGRQDVFGIDNPQGIDDLAGFVDFDSTFGSEIAFQTTYASDIFSFPTVDGGNWITAFRVNDPPGEPFPSGTGGGSAFTSWKNTALSGMGDY